MFFRFLGSATLYLVMLTAISGCASGRGTQPLMAPEEFSALTLEEERGGLRAAVLAEIDDQRGSDDASRAVMQHYRPYYFREYYEFPEGDDFELDIIEMDSRTTPYAAQAVVRKIRYATEMHKKRDDARADEDFYRDAGREYISYEWTSGEWRRLGSLFVAEETERMIDGSWQTAYRPSGTTLPDPAESKGFFGRTLDTLQFWK